MSFIFTGISTLANNPFLQTRLTQFQRFPLTLFTYNTRNANTYIVLTIFLLQKTEQAIILFDRLKNTIYQNATEAPGAYHEAAHVVHKDTTTFFVTVGVYPSSKHPN
jgi:Zn-dependent protease with chaperone function